MGAVENRARSTIAKLLSASARGTHRSSPKHHQSLAHGNPSDAANRAYNARGVWPPANTIQARPRAATASAAARVTNVTAASITRDGSG
jgi:hypothetical protein